MLVTEHSMRPEQQHEAKERLGPGFVCHMSELDPEKNIAVGGTACILRGPKSLKVIQPKPAHKDTLPYLTEGRLGLYALHIAAHEFVLAYVVYGWQGADHKLSLIHI